MKLEIERGGAFTPSRSEEFGEQTGVENGSLLCKWIVIIAES